MQATISTELSSGFSNPVIDASNCFRDILEAMSHPAKVITLPNRIDANDLLNETALAILLTLGDFDTKVYLAPECDTQALRNYLKFHTGCVITETPNTATFAILSPRSNLEICDLLPQGTDEYPDRSATVILLCDAISNNAGHVFSGPGIQKNQQIEINPLPKGFWNKVTNNHNAFPCGLDWIFASPNQIAALPRTTKLEPSLCM